MTLDEVVQTSEDVGATRSRKQMIQRLAALRKVPGQRGQPPFDRRHGFFVP